MAKILGKKIVVVGFGIDEMHHTASKKYMERILRNADYLCPRDDYSFNECIRVRGGHDGLIKGADLLFSMPDVGSNRKGRKKKIAVLSITRAAGVYSSSGCILEENKIRRSIRHLVTGLTESGFEVRLVSLQKRFGERDYELCREFVSGGSISHIHADSLESIESVIDGASVVIGMRFHALVFAALKGIPFVGIAHERKISAICEEFSMPYLTLSDFMSNNENVIKLAERLPRLDRTKVEKLRKLAENNFRFLEMME